MFIITTKKIKEIGNKNQIWWFFEAWLGCSVLPSCCPRQSRIRWTLNCCSKMVEEHPFYKGRNRHKSKGIEMEKWEKKNERGEKCCEMHKEWMRCFEWSVKGGFYSWVWQLKFSKNSSQRATPWPATYVAKLMLSTLPKMAWGKSKNPPIVKGFECNFNKTSKASLQA